MHLQSRTPPLPTRERAQESVIRAIRDLNCDDEREVRGIDTISQHVDDSLDVADLASRLEGTYGIVLTNKEVACRVRIMDLAETIVTRTQEGQGTT